MSDIVKTNGNGTSENSLLVMQAITPKQLLEQVNLIQQVMRDVMKEKEHYGKIPGCGDKMVLMKSGAEKLCFTFRLRPEFDVTETVYQNGHKEFRVKCKIFSMVTGLPVADGVGSCSTLESKYRYRTGPTESTGRSVPKEYWDLRKSDPQKAQEILGGKGFTTKKNDAGNWEIFRQGEKVENDNPADQYNTVLKMAKKRAFVDSTITATAASDIFTQDLDEDYEAEVKHEVKQESKSVNPEDAKYANAQEAETIPLSEAPQSVQASVKGEAPKGESPLDKAKAFVLDGYVYSPKAGKEFYNPDHTIFMNKKGVEKSARVTLNEEQYKQFVKWNRNNTEAKTTANDYTPPKDNSDLPF
jgi:hypothetical protein